ncbi:unnamed protein product [Mytilus edulis]|uniref:Uncharacterized protein n=1 Tax=Mytilus edulis TaxID=6550 RepID=A0A8S3UFN3_MYTED|nr:unnamed protein product [Mytilus edulis]
MDLRLVYVSSSRNPVDRSPDAMLYTMKWNFVEQSSIEKKWENIKEVYQNTSEKIIGFRKSSSKQWLTSDTWKAVDERAKLKEKVLSTRSSRLKEQTQKEYAEKDKEVKKRARKDKKNHLEERAEEAEKAAARGDLSTVYKITKELCGQSKQPPPVKDNNGKIITTEREQAARWETERITWACVFHKRLPGKLLPKGDCFLFYHTVGKTLGKGKVNEFVLVKSTGKEVTAKQRKDTLMVKPKSVLQSPPLVFSTVFSRQKSHIKNNILKHWDKLKDDEEAKLLFDKRPLFAFRRHKNLKDTVTSATLDELFTLMDAVSAIVDNTDMYKAHLKLKRSLTGGVSHTCKLCTQDANGKMKRNLSEDGVVHLRD